MNKIILKTILCLFMSHILSAQTPQFINYQSVVRNITGEVVKNQSVRFRLSITDGVNGSTIYSETHQATTNLLGLVNLNIGSGTPVSNVFSNVNWGSGVKFLKVEIDIKGGTNYTLLGSQQFVSVPYALYADKTRQADTAGYTNTAIYANRAGSIANQWEFNNNGIHYNGGKVGIGTSTPTHKLTLEGSHDGDDHCFINVRNTTTNFDGTAFARFYSGSSNTFTSLAHHNSNFYEPEHADFGQLWSTGRGLILRASPTGDPNNGVIKFMTGLRAGGFSNERMRIEANGNIGIGTPSPKAKVEVSGGDVYVSDINKGIILKSPNGNCWRVTIDNSGNFVRTSIACPN